MLFIRGFDKSNLDKSSNALFEQFKARIYSLGQAYNSNDFSLIEIENKTIFLEKEVDRLRNKANQDFEDIKKDITDFCPENNGFNIEEIENTLKEIDEDIKDIKKGRDKINEAKKDPNSTTDPGTRLCGSCDNCNSCNTECQTCDSCQTSYTDVTNSCGEAYAACSNTGACLGTMYGYIIGCGHGQGCGACNADDQPACTSCDVCNTCDTGCYECVGEYACDLCNEYNSCDPCYTDDTGSCSWCNHCNSCNTFCNSMVSMCTQCFVNCYLMCYTGDASCKSCFSSCDNFDSKAGCMSNNGSCGGASDDMCLYNNLTLDCTFANYHYLGTGIGTVANGACTKNDYGWCRNAMIPDNLNDYCVSKNTLCDCSVHNAIGDCAGYNYIGKCATRNYTGKCNRGNRCDGCNMRDGNNCYLCQTDNTNREIY